MKLDRLSFNFPRKAQGDRFRAQATKFYNISKSNIEGNLDNLEWAEQSARKSIMYDYTNHLNWGFLLELKIALKDEKGLQYLFEDLLAVLGKDPFLISQLKNINLLSASKDLFYSILKREPLNADIWWEGVVNGDFDIDEFKNRCKKMDFRDRRSNIIFGRRLERLRINGYDEIFLELMPYLLAHRPDNFELWTELGKHYEHLNQIKESLLCYEQVLIFKPNDKNKERLNKIIKNNFDKISDFLPNKEEETSFHNKLVKLARNSNDDSIDIDNNMEREELENPLEERLKKLLNNKDFQEAFFLSRSLIADGQSWAEKYFILSKEGLLND